MKVSECLLFFSARTVRVVFILFCLTFLASGCGTKKIRIAEPLSETRSTVVRTAMDLMGKPYKNGGRGPDSFDCSGLVYFAYKKTGVVLPATAEEQGRSGVGIAREAVLPGDLVVFKIKREYHVGIMVNDKEFVHASKSRGVAVDELSMQYWANNLQGFRSFL